ncbi:hypothetical protein GJ744_002757 [Endocarpon pusillum]|uniref:Uncharacterized protein n=1 Tax=Endocarpon pusillum TaxID=364733 RepID=A0A8H7AR65_9EURO|nr:hypothetical protein GJ744_002757 [Endocarpon pusillum]
MNGAYKRESYGAKDWLAASLAGGRYFWAGYAPWKDNHCPKTIASLGDHLRTNQSCQGMRPETTIHSEQCRLFVHGYAGRAAGSGEGKFAVCLDLIFIQAWHSDYNALRGPSLLNSTLTVNFDHHLLLSFIVYHHESPLFQSLLFAYLYSYCQSRAWCCEFLLRPFGL